MSAAMDPGRSSRLRRRMPGLARYGIALVPLAVLTAIMLSAVGGLADQSRGLASQVNERIDDTGVSHPVTAVLLNLRAYDTWLELVVLLIAVVAVLTTRRIGLESPAGDSPLVVRGLTQRLFPVIALVTVFVLGLGTASPGGAFQAGSLLAAGLYLLHLSAYPVTSLGGETIRRGTLVAGTAVFIAVALGGALAGVRVLELAPDLASPLIVAIEVAATISIAITLAMLLIAAAPEGTLARGSGRETDGQDAR